MLIQKLEELAKAPLSTIDRFRQEVPKIMGDRTIPVHELMGRIAQFQQEICQEGEARFAEFVNEADSVEQKLLRRLEELREIRERAQLIRGIMSSMFRPALPAELLDMMKRFFQGLEDLRWREEGFYEPRDTSTGVGHSEPPHR